MLPRFLARLALLILLAAPIVAPAPATAAAADWTKTVTALPNGAFLVGNPDARTRLVEYFSYSCPHCADFAEKPTAELKALWVKDGRVAIEYRNFIRDGFDLSAALLARCGGASKFLANHDAIFANYETWIRGAQAYYEAHKDKPPQPDRAKLVTEIADQVGLTALVARNGLATAALHQCLADKQALATVLELTAGAWDADPNFEGTPTFLIDGKVARGVHAWPALKPLLAALPASTN